MKAPTMEEVQRAMEEDEATGENNNGNTTSEQDAVQASKVDTKEEEETEKDDDAEEDPEMNMERARSMPANHTSSKPTRQDPPASSLDEEAAVGPYTKKGARQENSSSGPQATNERALSSRPCWFWILLLTLLNVIVSAVSVGITIVIMNGRNNATTNGSNPEDQGFPFSTPPAPSMFPSPTTAPKGPLPFQSPTIPTASAPSSSPQAQFVTSPAPYVLFPTGPPITPQPTKGPTPLLLTTSLPLGSSLIAYDLVDSNSLQLDTFSIPGPNIDSLASGFNVYYVRGAAPFAVVDESVRFPTDGGGIIRSTNTNAFFGVLSTDTNPFFDPRSATWDFTILAPADSGNSQYSFYYLSIDMGAMGPFESGSFFRWTYSWNGLAEQDTARTAFESHVDPSISYTYSMEVGTTRTLQGRIFVNNDNLGLTNIMQTMAVELEVPSFLIPNQLRLTLTASSKGPTQAMAFQNIRVYGI